jgi:ABC-type uncharacterized transport system substrate-binding protein
MRRRNFIALLGGAAAVSIPWPPAVVRAQAQPKMLRVGFVGIQPRESPLYGAFLKRMAEMGYQEGRNFTFDYIQTPNIDGYENSYRELAARKVDVFLAVGNEPALRAARTAAEGRPIVFLAIDFDPLTKGYVGNLSRPGGNITGIFVRVPALYSNLVSTPDGGLLAYAVDTRTLFHRAASYVDRILKGAKPGELPVEQPTQFELSVNLKTAKALGLDIPATLIARADEVIE